MNKIEYILRTKYSMYFYTGNTPPTYTKNLNKETILKDM